MIYNQRQTKYGGAIFSLLLPNKSTTISRIEFLLLSHCNKYLYEVQTKTLTGYRLVAMRMNINLPDLVSRTCFEKIKN